ncbi:proline--tRNA ligase [Helicobacter brantae]|uniref:Proline--tRNA ligase n=1 Tax=Helicobacter brantae TaxID=375927 RepID=A0A3D8J0G7_9HELI|nr:proline--tRNA ligase [Helicobacter brantae]RDU70988.1 proline--tRNA ligase [Helicobacter brantae]
MRMSKSFIITTKEAPKDADLKSQQYLVRAGYIQQVGAGIYNLLPLGYSVLENIKKIIKKHMDASGAQELSLGFVTPASLWQKSGRFEKYGKELLRFKDRKDQDFVLGPTHEEAIVECVSGRVKSYKQLPLNLYQMHLKFRDELRPRFGLIRGREFVMKDAYSFHESIEDLNREFDVMEQTYRAIFDELGIKYAVVEADSGAIGGSGSKEFMLLASCGEDTLIICPNCGYASNIEAGKRKRKTYPSLERELGEISTPNLKSIQELCTLGIAPYHILKCVAKGVRMQEGESKVALFFLRGSDELEETKAYNAIVKQESGAMELFDIESEELEKRGYAVGFMGVGCKADFVVFDCEVEQGEIYLSGANKADTHAYVRLEGVSDFADLVAVQEGDKCACCGEKLSYQKGIEIGHIFKLGDRYSAPMGATFLDRNGKAQNFIMGCYGIGVSRLISAIVEQKCDERGIIWGENIAPYECMILISNIKNEEQKAIGEKLYAHLLSQGKRVLLDDRDERFGAKIADFELLGIPYGYIIGKELENGKVELVKREDLSKQSLEISKLFGE